LLWYINASYEVYRGIRGGLAGAVSEEFGNVPEKARMKKTTFNPMRIVNNFKSMQSVIFSRSTLLPYVINRLLLPSGLWPFVEVERPHPEHFRKARSPVGMTWCGLSLRICSNAILNNK
jgi:hypothetical protein